MRRRRGRAATVARRIATVLLLAGVGAAIAFVVWAEHPRRAEAAPLAAAQHDDEFTYREGGAVVTLDPKQPNGTGLVFVADTRVDAPAYAAKLGGLAEAGITVVIIRPLLNHAILDPRPLSSFAGVAPLVRRWYVGGHGTGGARACQYASDGGVSGLVLLGASCAVDLSKSRLAVLSIAGTRDGLTTAAQIAAARHLLPRSAAMQRIRGADHAQFGDYGDEPGDGVATATDAAVQRAITDDVAGFMLAN